MNEYIYTIFIAHKNGGWNEVKFNFQDEDDDEPINACCGNSDPSNDFLGEYFLIHTLKGRVFLFQPTYSTEVNPIRVGNNDLHVDHIACSHNCIFLSSGNNIYFFSFNAQKREIFLEETYLLHSPVLSMKPASTSTIAIFVHLQDYSLKMIRKYHNELIDIDSNVLLYDVSDNSILFIKSDLSRQIINYKFEPKGETLRYINGQNDVNNKKQLPYHVYFHKYDGDDNFQCIEEITPGVIDFDTDMRFSKLISRQNNLIYCDEECHKLSFWKEEPFFEIPDQIILFDQLDNANDFLVVIRHASFGFTPLFLKPHDISSIDSQLELIDIQTGELTTTFHNFYDSNIFLESVLIILENFQANQSLLIDNCQNIIQIINWIIDYQSTLIDTFLLSRILTYQFFNIILIRFNSNFESEFAITPISVSCLAVLINKAIQIAPCKPSQKTLFMLRTISEENKPIIPLIPPIRTQFNEVHRMSMIFIQNMPENFAIRTLSALLSCLKYTKCSILFFAELCFQLNIIQKVDENVYYLVKDLLIEGNTTKNENLPKIVRLLLHSYRFISSNEPNSELLKKIRNFFEHKPQDLDNATMMDIQNVFNEYMSNLKPKFQKFLNQIRFYPQKDIAPEIQKFIKVHLPIPMIDTEKFHEDIEKLSKSGKLLRIKIEYINMIQDADDYITLCQVANLSRKKSSF
ncbi:hypothetical protein M9Y10_009958 [Tritrichomonas musculus]|uniref:Mic1 domain-containing protein n=1 Tax=Tritrichomonas musculus TaxID=1915356 RepID=A0ABR2IPZ5_9EUKA